jgi:preprotein translocase subunit YajC
LSPTLLILVLAMGVIWIAFIRPQKRRQQLQREMLNQIEPGAEVLTAAGIYGTVVEAEGDEIKLEIADGVVVKVARRAIGAVIPPEVEEEDEQDDEPEALEAGEEEPAEPEPAPAVAEATDGDAAAKPRS